MKRSSADAAKITAAGIYRDPVRSSRSHFVKVRGLRWICAHPRAHPVGRPRVGVAVPDGARPLRTLRPTPATALQAPDHLGASADPADASLGARSSPGRRRGPGVRCAGTARRRAHGGHPRRAPASGCAPLRATAAATTRAEGAAPRGGRAPPQSHGLATSRRRSGPPHDGALVRRAGSSR